MRYFKFAVLLCAPAIFAAIAADAQGVPPDFAASAKDPRELLSRDGEVAADRR